MFKVYALLNKEDRIVYVGVTKRSLHDRWRSHKNAFPERAELKIMLLQEFENRFQADEAEVLFQKQYNTVENGLNKIYGRCNNDGKCLVETGKNTRFGSREKYPGEEEKRLNNLRKVKEKEKIRIKCVNTGIEYESISMCAKVLGLSIGNLSMVLKGKRPHTKGLKFIYCPIKTESD